MKRLVWPWLGATLQVMLLWVAVITFFVAVCPSGIGDAGMDPRLLWVWVPLSIWVWWQFWSMIRHDNEYTSWHREEQRLLAQQLRLDW